jgi:hypothetical protein
MIMFPRLAGISKIASEPNHSYSPTYILDIASMSTASAWKDFNRELSIIADELQWQSFDASWSFTDTMSSRLQPPNEHVYHFIQNSFDAIACRCGAIPQRQLGLRLGTYKRKSSGDDRQIFCTFIARDETAHDWSEVRLLKRHDVISEEWNEPRMQESEYVNNQTCICEFLGDFKGSNLRVDVLLEQGNLQPAEDMAQYCMHHPNALRSQIDFTHLLSRHAQDWGERSNWTLAVALAYSLLYLYDCSPNGSPTGDRWKRRNIFFIENGTRIPLRPFFRVEEVQKRGQCRYHPQPQLLELGVILLEIHLGKTLETHLSLNHEITDLNELYVKAVGVYRQEERRLETSKSLQYQQAVKACLTPGTISKSLTLTPAHIRHILFDKIVRPLEEQLAVIMPRILETNDVDEEIARFNLATFSQSPEVLIRHDMPSHQRHDSTRPGDGPQRVGHVPIVDVSQK